MSDTGDEADGDEDEDRSEVEYMVGTAVEAEPPTNRRKAITGGSEELVSMLIFEE